MITKTQAVFLLLLILQLLACNPVQLPAPTPLTAPSPAATPAPVTIRLDAPFDLIVNQQGELESADLTIQFQTVLNDWRCPSKVNCSEAGNATVVINASLTDLEPVRFELNVIDLPGSQDTIYGPYQIRLMKLDPYPETIEQIIPLEDYRATLVVNAVTPTPTVEAAASPTPSIPVVETDDGPPSEAANAYDRGLTSLYGGEVDEAIANFTEAIALYPTYVEAYQFRGDAYRQIRRYDLARADYQQVLALNPEPEIKATVTTALQAIAQAIPVLPTATITPTPAPATPLPSPPLTIALDKPFTLKINQRGELDADGLTIEFYALLEDSRCPRQVECYWAGQARLGIHGWLTTMEPITFELNTNPSPDQSVISYDGYQIRLLSLDPYPETTDQPILPEDYQATFEVTKK